MVISSSKWFRKTGRRWSGFAFYHPFSNGLFVWNKFRGTRKRGRNWDQLAKDFREQIMFPHMLKEQS